jgi:hypothetical protein
VPGGGVPLAAEKFLHFRYESDEFWCIFGGIGVKIRLPICNGEVATDKFYLFDLPEYSLAIVGLGV